MRSLERSITVRAPIDIAYATWVNYQKFPVYMPHVISVERISKTRTRWVIDVLGYRVLFEAEIDEMKPNRLISWHSISNVEHFGSAFFSPTEEGTVVTLRILIDTKNLPSDLADDLELAWNEFEESFEEALNSFKRYTEKMWYQLPLAM